MSRPAGPRSVTARDVLFAVLAAVAVLGLGFLAVQHSQALTVEQRATEDATVLADVAAGVAVDLEQRLAGVADSARDATAPGGRPPRGFVPVEPSTMQSTEPALSTADLADRSVAAVLDRARDSAEPIVGPPVDLGDGPRTLLVAAAYSTDAGGGLPRTTVARRARIAGWAVAPVDLGELLRSNLPDGSVATISDGQATWSATADAAPSRLPEQTLDTHGHQLRIRAGDASGVGVRAPTVALALAASLLAAVAAGSVLGAARRLHASQDEARDRAAQVQLIGEVAPLVQQSLELSDVLPAIAVLLSDHFGLAGVALSTATSNAGELEVFSMGADPVHATTAVLQPPAFLPADATLALALQRGGRSVGQLRLVAGRALGEEELLSLRALSELMTAAVVNAALYASQQDALERLRDLDALKTVFLSTASHELRTPVTAIEGFATMLNNNWDRFDEAQRRDFISRISANAGSLNAVVQDLLDFSLLDKGTLTVALEETDLGALVGSVVKRLSPILKEHEIVFSASPAPTIAGDVNGLERIVTNLLTNAVKFSPADTTVTVTVGPAGGSQGAEVVVSDEGPGIPPEERAQVFTRFFRGSGDAVVQTRGVGIGLSVVSELVARLGGEIEVDEAPGGGARFTVRFPASSAQRLAEEVAHAPTT